jgi:hypothetical protein
MITAMARAGEMSIASRMGSSARFKSDIMIPQAIHLLKILNHLIDAPM